MKDGKIRMEDVAKLAGVSKATVSYVLNQREAGCRISPATKLKILQVCENLHYRPDATGVMLAQYRNAYIKLLVLSPWVYDDFSELTHQTNAQLRQRRDKDLLDVSYQPYDRAKLSRVLRPALAARYDAIIVLGLSPNDERFLAKNRGNLPNVILINRRLAGYSATYGNDCEAARNLIRKIDLKKYQRFVLLRMEGVASFLDARADGFAKGITESHRKVQQFALRDSREVWQELCEHVDVRKTPTLVMSPLYTTAAILLNRALAAGVKVPEELGIVGFDIHTMLGDFVAPAITTVDPDLPAMINAAIDIICQNRGKKAIEGKAIPAVLKIGGSTCNKPNAK